MRTMDQLAIVLSTVASLCLSLALFAVGVRASDSGIPRGSVVAPVSAAASVPALATGDAQR